jgi:hypothetical protein
MELDGEWGCGRDAMLTYRAYLLDDDDHIVKRQDFEAANDTAALETARQYVDGHDVEVWQSTRILSRLKHEK